MNERLHRLVWGTSAFAGLCLLSLVTGCAGVQPRFHEVKKGESLNSIAEQYQVPTKELARYNTQRVTSSKTLKPGVKLYIPFEESSGWDGGDVEDGAGPASDATAEYRIQRVPNTAVATRASFSWPVQGFLTSGYGWRKRRMHDGVDIAAPRGTPVIASRSGHVLYAGNRISGYGNLVILKHADSFSTVYAHLQKLEVKKGQFISRGQRLGRVGKTGRATNYHLHFEVRNARVPVDPLLYLQGQYAANRITGR